MDYGANAGMKFDCTIYDMAEGTLHVTVGAADKNDAYEVAGIAASERGCANVIEVVVGVFE
jgi:hypothetical protein